MTPKIHNMKLSGFDVTSVELSSDGIAEVTIAVGKGLSRISLNDSGSVTVVELGK